MPYRLNIEIGATFTSASYQMAEESGVLPLSPSARDLPSAQFVADGKVQVASLAETLRSIVSTANQQLGEAPASVEVTYPGSWDPSRLFLLWEALVLAGIPDAVRPRPLLTRSPWHLRLVLSRSRRRPRPRSSPSPPHPSRSAAGPSLQRSPPSARAWRLASSSMVVRVPLHSPETRSRER